jgi:hypothetical protein
MGVEHGEGDLVGGLGKGGRDQRQDHRDGQDEG